MISTGFLRPQRSKCLLSLGPTWSYHVTWWLINDGLWQDIRTELNMKLRRRTTSSSHLSIWAPSGRHFAWNCSQPGLNMSVRARSHTDLQMAGKTSRDNSLHKSLSMSSSSSINRGGPFGVSEEIKVLDRTPRRPVRVVRPVSAVTSGGSFLQINHLQGELVRKRKVRTHKLQK